MENKKLKTNLLKAGISKIGDKLTKLVPPAILAATLLNFNVYAQSPANTKGKSIKAPTPIHKEAESRYQSKNDTFEKLYYSDLFKLNVYNQFETAVRNDLVHLLADMNAETLELSGAYYTAEKNAIKNSRLTAEQVNQIAQNRSENKAVIDASFSHYMELMLKTLTLSRFRANAAEIHYLDHNDFVNEFLQFNVEDERDIRHETNIILGLARNDIKQYLNYTNAGKTGSSVQLEKNLNKIKAMTTVSKQTKANYNAILNLIDDTARILYVSDPSRFGSYEMCRGLIMEFAKSYSMNELLNHVEKVGYNVKDLKADEIISGETKFNAIEARTGISNKDFTVALGADARTMFTNNFDLTYGGEIAGKFNFENNSSFQVLGKVEPGLSTNGHRWSVPLKAGVNFDKTGVSTPFGAGFKYTLPLSNTISIVFNSSVLLNLQRSNAEFGTMFGMIINTRRMKFIFGVNIDYVHEWDKNLPGPIPNDPNIKPDDPNNKPDDPNIKPDDPNNKPDDPNIKPDDPNNKPDDPNIKPNEEIKTEHVGDSSNSKLEPSDPEKLH